MGGAEGERAVRLAARMMELGVSREGILEMFAFPLDQVEAQINWLPYRKAKRPGAFLIEAVRRNYSPPPAYYAHLQTRKPPLREPLDQGAEPGPGRTDARPPRHGAQGPPRDG